MPLQFSCPNGHTITCNEKLAGKPAKCPQCSVKFVIPPPGQAHADPVSRKDGAGGSGVSGSGVSGSGTGSGVSGSAVSGSAVRTPAKEETIAFLCPNGHKLNGPASLQGRAGQCPECGAKFRIPSYEEADEDDNPELAEDDEILTGEEVADDTEFDQHDLEQNEIVEGSGSYETFTPVEDPFEATLGEAPEEYPAEDFPEEFVPALPDFENGTHPLAGIFTLLWQQRRMGGSVEMQLSAGELLSPDYFSPELSQSTHGVFAVRAKDGTYTITTVPWEAVTRVSLRKTDTLPPGLFDE